MTHSDVCTYINGLVALDAQSSKPTQWCLPHKPHPWSVWANKTVGFKCHSPLFSCLFTFFRRQQDMYIHHILCTYIIHHILCTYITSYVHTCHMHVTSHPMYIHHIHLSIHVTCMSHVKICTYITSICLYIPSYVRTKMELVSK